MHFIFYTKSTQIPRTFYGLFFINLWSAKLSYSSEVTLSYLAKTCNFSSLPPLFVSFSITPSFNSSVGRASSRCIKFPTMRHYTTPHLCLSLPEKHDDSILN